MQQVQHRNRDQVTERRAAEDIAADIVAVTDEGFSVRLQRTAFTAEAVQQGEERTLTFDEETEVEEFSAGFVDQHYMRFLPSAWELIAAAHDPVEASVVQAAAPAVPAPTADASTATAPAVEPMGKEARNEPVPLPPAPAAAEPYEAVDHGSGGREYMERAGAPEDRRDTAVQPRLDEDVMERTAATQQATPTIEGQYSGASRPAVNGADAVQQLFAYTDLDGTLETVKDYGLTDDFDGETPAAYWLDIDGFDMDRTEYFINGELAEDAIDAYQLGPGDTNTFVEADIFDRGGGAADSYCGRGESLELADVQASADAVERYDIGRDLPWTVEPGTATYTAGA
ncbi:MAG: hypothetical protein SVW02_00785 [Candidatus Nanohaloarchaea archaeon]|nr:hypothetical protein [Candidatus Nanohaloarchaea archaeon]